MLYFAYIHSLVICNTFFVFSANLWLSLEWFFFYLVVFESAESQVVS